MSEIKLSGLMQPIIVRENTYGVNPLDFSNVNTKGYGYAQSKDTPSDFNVNNNMVYVPNTTGSNVVHEGAKQKGLYDVTGTITHMIQSNDMILLLSMFFQNAYQYVPTITDNAITGIVVNGTTATVTVGDTGTLTDSDGIVISNSVDSTEDGVYIINNITATTYDILNVAPTFSDSDLTRVITAIFNTHSAMIEYHDPNELDCSKMKLDSSFTLIYPKSWDKTDCDIGSGEEINGFIAKTLNMDFINSSYSIDGIASNFETDGTNFPTKKSQYEKPVSFNGIMNKNSSYLEINGVEQKNTIELSLDITAGVGEDLKNRGGSKLTENSTDTVTIEGNYKVKFDDELTASNYSSLILKQRNDVQNGLVMTFGLNDSNGASIKFTGKASFNDMTTAKELNGTTLTVPFNIVVADEQQNFIVEAKNGYNKSLSEFFRSSL